MSVPHGFLGPRQIGRALHGYPSQNERAIRLNVEFFRDSSMQDTEMLSPKKVMIC